MKTTKKFIVITLCVFLIAAMGSPALASGISVQINGNILPFDQPPIIEGGRTLVPLRAIFEALGAEVEWVASTQTVTAVREGVTVSLKIGSNILTRNGEQIRLDVPAQIVGGRTLVPARAIAESFGAEVSWNQNTQTMTINVSWQTVIPSTPALTPPTEPTPQTNQIAVSQNRSPVLSDKAVTFNPISFESGNLRYTLIGADYSHIDGGGGVSLKTSESIALSFANGFERTIFWNKDIIGTRDRQLRLYFVVEPTSGVTSPRDMPSANLKISAKDNTGSSVGIFYNSLKEGHPTFETPLYGMVVCALFSDDEWIDIDLGGTKYRLMINIIPMIVD